MEPAGPPDLAPIFPMALIEQEVSGEPTIEIPDEVREIYALWRPTPLFRARRLEKALDTPAHIYYKYEGVSPAGSHKPNSAIPQAYYNRRRASASSSPRPVPASGAARLALACKLFGLECEVFMVGVCYDQKPYRRAMIETWGGTVHRSPSDLTDAGRSQAAHPNPAASASRSPRRSRSRRRRRHQLLPRLGAQPRLPAPDGHRPGVPRRSSRWRASTPTS